MCQNGGSTGFRDPKWKSSLVWRALAFGERSREQERLDRLCLFYRCLCSPMLHAHVVRREILWLLALQADAQATDAALTVSMMLF